MSLLSDLGLLEYGEGDASISALGVVFEFSPPKLQARHQILKGLSVAVFGEVANTTALDPETRNRLFAQGRASGFLNLSGGVISFNIDYLLDLRTAQVFSASA